MATTAADFVPETKDLARLREAAAGCRGCDLYRDATQTVFGEGTRRARTMMIGEQPGDQEDRRGEPFVGPAGRLLDRALEESGIERDGVYVTNAVKHFKFRRDDRGSRRIHKKPGRTEIVACRPWLDAELDAVNPDLVILLGATAAQAVFGPDFRITERRGEVLDLPGGSKARDARAVATVHPSSILRSRERDEAYAAFVADLKAAVAVL
ncbi:UdgX family uracil-DNA binding protein [Amycolatopsis sp. 195334CR]|uniref:UdgX family uracil-DNA binding protein n=1 Tax=Amycolatopsis sp. 195334CR TaxID=2814588 RepID=UPI001A8DA8F9|nr:UdgX family uracil-DNA binding protein [Amycolatopsis sp. 195334CR]MBN6041339.1 UdgX family uracil-DNA binding protein [Amycolatopsis sp. 195334CR]